MPGLALLTNTEAGFIPGCVFLGARVLKTLSYIPLLSETSHSKERASCHLLSSLEVIPPCLPSLPPFDPWLTALWSSRQGRAT